MTNEATATIGHNNPPSLLEIARAAIDELMVDLPDELATYSAKSLERLKNLSDSAMKVPVKLETAEDAEKVTTFISQIKACIKSFETDRDYQKQPYWDGGKAVDAYYNPLKAKLTGMDTVVSKILLTWNQELRRQDQAKALAASEKARLETEKRLADAAALEAAGAGDVAEKKLEAAERMDDRAQRLGALAQTGSGMGMTRSETGAASSIVTTWAARIVDRHKIDGRQLLVYFTDEEIQKAANRRKDVYVQELKVNADAPVPVVEGIVFEKTESTRVRS